MNQMMKSSALPSASSGRRGRIGAALRVLSEEARAQWSRAELARLTTPPPSDTTIACLPALYEPEQIARVKACGFRSTLPGELEKLEATHFPERPVTRYDLEDAIIAGGRVYAGDARYFLSERLPGPALRGPFRQFSSAMLLNSQQGLKYFGHWLRDDCAVYEGIRGEAAPLISMQRPHWPDAAFYEIAFNQRWDVIPFAHVGRLTLYREMGFSRDKARRLRLLRAQLRAALPERNTGRIVYVSRGKLGAERHIANEDEVENAFAKAGIHVVEPGQGGEALVRELLDAAMIITVEGSQASHGVYSLAEGGSMLILQPPERFYNPHHEWARLMGMRYGITIGEKDGRRFHIHPDEVFCMIDRLLAAPRMTDA